ncbi:4'-phosphopantetheinyl transferase family protein [Wohlfahrtiimonas larvae]|uniref:4'-phosphopantetheinyl transferase domain-containing protein n=1 Tax=Wohlfahrtiimonas larvae TaxID=1157986 RepID=A0ABP9MC01_9GAMM|nr:4'-phosphopantetheinyl transferase superfamily protein [Wohlfahrtiimonas larvae]
MNLKHIIVQMPINDITLTWARNNFPHLTQTQYSDKRNNYLLLSRSLLEYILQQYFNIHKLPEIAYLKHGKPYFLHHSELSFNITHTNHTMAIIVANNAPVGIDIEMIKIRKNFQGLEEKVLHTIEKSWLTQQPNYLHGFFTLWSAKEAYLKATGTGLSGLTTLRLDMHQQFAYGPLENGYLYIDTEPKNESFVCYLPTKITPNLYSFDGQVLMPFSREWQAIKCISHYPKKTN